MDDGYSMALLRLGIHLAVWVSCVSSFVVLFRHVSLYDGIVEGHCGPEKVSCTILDASHDFVGLWRVERFSVFVEAGGKIYEVRDKDTYHLYHDRVGQSFPAELSSDMLFGVRIGQSIHLFGDYGVNWKVDSLLHKQQYKEVSKKCRQLS